MKKYILLLMIVFFAYSASASTIGVSPSILNYAQMVKDGYAQSRITVSTSFEQDVEITATKEGTVASWITFVPNNSTFISSLGNPYTFTIIMEPPQDTANGNYTGLIKFRTSELARVGRGAGSSVIAQVSILIFVEVTGEEIIKCRAGGITTFSTELSDPFGIRAIVHNDGNVRLRPEFLIDVWDQFRSRKVYSTRILGDQILPTTSREILEEVDHNLDIGQYFADVVVSQCGVSKTTTFDIVREGELADNGELLGINTNDVSYQGEPLPIASLFRNLGNRKVLAQFKGQILDLSNNKVVEILESDALEVNPQEVKKFEMFYVPKQSGQFQISGRVVYNNKITFDEKSKIIKIVSTKEASRSWIFYIFLYLIIGLLIMIFMTKIRKAKRRKIVR